MKKIDPYDEIAKRGRFIHIYGVTEVGKSTSSFQSLPQPILTILGEARNPRTSLEALGEKKVEFYKVPVFFDDPTELREFLSDLLRNEGKELDQFASIFFDGASNFYNNSVGALLEDEYYEMMEAGNKIKRPIAQQTERDMKVYGAMASELLRIYNLLARFSSQHNKVVVSASLVRTIDRRIRIERMNKEPLMLSNPQFTELVGRFDIPESVDSYDVPNFDGKVFLKEFPGLVDMIGRVERRHDANGEVVYPPTVNFDAKESMCKFTGKRGKTSGPLDFTKILGL